MELKDGENGSKFLYDAIVTTQGRARINLKVKHEEIPTKAQNALNGANRKAVQLC
jgi:hypothetical protein